MPALITLIFQTEIEDEGELQEAVENMEAQAKESIAMEENFMEQEGNVSVIGATWILM